MAKKPVFRCNHIIYFNGQNNRLQPYDDYNLGWVRISRKQINASGWVGNTK